MALDRQCHADESSPTFTTGCSLRAAGVASPTSKDSTSVCPECVNHPNRWKQGNEGSARNSARAPTVLESADRPASCHWAIVTPVVLHRGVILPRINDDHAWRALWTFQRNRSILPLARWPISCSAFSRAIRSFLIARCESSLAFRWRDSPCTCVCTEFCSRRGAVRTCGTRRSPRSNWTVC